MSKLTFYIINHLIRTGNYHALLELTSVSGCRSCQILALEFTGKTRRWLARLNAGGDVGNNTIWHSDYALVNSIVNFNNNIITITMFNLSLLCQIWQVCIWGKQYTCTCTYDLVLTRLIMGNKWCFGCLFHWHVGIYFVCTLGRCIIAFHAC